VGSAQAAACAGLSLTRWCWGQIPARNSATLAYKHKKTNPNPNPNPSPNPRS